MMRPPPRLASLVTAYAAFALAGCGGGSGAEAGICSGTFTACGGDPTGDWEVASTCLGTSFAQLLNDSFAAQSPDCAGAAKSASLSASGTVAYHAGTVAYNMTISTTTSFSFTEACLQALAPGVTADASCAALAPSPGDPEETGSCSFSGSACSCTGASTSPDTSVSSYTVSGATITESSGATYEFCVSGTTMSQRVALVGTNYGVMTLSRQ
jgi:hypothetical protein